MRKLPAKQLLFTEEYPIDMNITKAAQRAGYSVKTAYSIGQRLLKKVEIQAAIAKAMAARSKRTEITQDMVLRELALLAFTDMADYTAWGPLGVTMVASEKLPQGATRAVSEISETITKEGSTVKFKLYDKIRSLELLGKHLGLFPDKKQIDFGGGLNVNFTVEFEKPDGMIVDAEQWEVMQSEEPADEDGEEAVG